MVTKCEAVPQIEPYSLGDRTSICVTFTWIQCLNLSQNTWSQ